MSRASSCWPGRAPAHGRRQDELLLRLYHDRSRRHAGRGAPGAGPGRHQHDQGRVRPSKNCSASTSSWSTSTATARRRTWRRRSTPPGAHRDAQGVRQLPALAPVTSVGASPPLFEFAGFPRGFLFTAWLALARTEVESSRSRAQSRAQLTGTVEGKGVIRSIPGGGRRARLAPARHLQANRTRRHRTQPAPNFRQTPGAPTDQTGATPTEPCGWSA